MSTPGPVKMYAFMLDTASDAKLDEITARIGEVLRLSRPNRSDALRRIILDFDVEAWAARQVPPQPAGAV
jgi:hypothetical protein